MDVNIRVPAIEKLLDYVASGIGAVAGPVLAPWKASRDAQAGLIEARNKAESLELIADAQAKARRFLHGQHSVVRGVLEIEPDDIRQRVEFQERKRHMNIVSAVQEAAAGLDGKEISDHEPDPDWTARFFNAVQDISSEDMRSIWARILSGEVEHPGRTSLRTLDVLRNMTREDARTFERICDFVIGGDFVFNGNELLHGPELTFTNVLSLQEIGLVNAPTFFVKKLTLSEDDGNLIGEYQDILLIIKPKNPGTDRSVSIPSFVLTRPGKDLYRIVKPSFCMDYLRSLARFLRAKDCRLSHRRIIEKLPDGRVRYTDPVDIEPEAPTGVKP